MCYAGLFYRPAFLFVHMRHWLSRYACYATADFATLLLLVAGIASGRLVLGHPNEVVVLLPVGVYKGTVYDSGLRWAIPLL